MLIAMAVWDTEENKRTEQTRQTLESLADTVDFTKHRIIISDNGSCEATQELYRSFGEVFDFKLILNGENLGTARAINRAWKYRLPGQHVLKMDNDVVIHQPGWADEMEEVFARDPSIGIVGLKRKDLAECPNSEVPNYRSILQMLPHTAGQRWIIVEECNHIMGTCQAFSSSLFDKIGYLYQGQDEGKIYGLDDTLASYRARMAGFKCVFLPTIDIDHIDPGGNDYTTWKQNVAADVLGFTGKGNWLGKVVEEYRTGKRDLYWEDK
jgi:GT2 family glycosyltransferase